MLLSLVAGIDGRDRSRRGALCLRGGFCGRRLCRRRRGGCFCRWGALFFRDGFGGRRRRCRCG